MDRKINHREIAQSLAMITQLGISLLAPVVLCAFIGSWIDRRFGCSVKAVLLILGVAAGARNAWILLKQIQQVSEKKGQKKDEQENK